MAKKKNISAVISLKDNMSATMRGIRREQKAFQKEVRQTRKEIQSANRQKMKVRMDSTIAHKKIQKLRKDLAPLRKKVATAVALKDEATAKTKKIKSQIRSIAKTIAKPAVFLKDKTTSVISKIKSKISSIAKIATIPLAIAGGAVGATLKSGMELEQQKISVRHFMGVGNKGKSNDQLDKMSSSYIKQLRDNANSTPFETGEVISAGTRALQIEGGNVGNAMDTVKLAEDMAAMNPEKSVSDAIEALADAKVGEMERLKEFGVKASSKDDFKTVQKQLQDMYAGGADKLASSGTGLWSTILGKLKSSVADTGLKMLDALKPAMSDLIGFIDSISPKLSQVGTVIGNGLGKAISWIKEQMPTIGPIFQDVFNSIGSVVQTVVPLIGQAITALQPVFKGLLTVAQAVFKGIATAVQIAAPIVSATLNALKPVFSLVGSALNVLGGVFTSVFNVIKSVVTTATNIVKSAINGVKFVINGVKSAVHTMGSVFSSVFNGIKTVVQNAYNFIKPILDKIKSGVNLVQDVASNLGGGHVPGQNALGTRYWKGGVSLVGEHGPELVQMPSATKVYTNRQTKDKMKSDINLVQNITNNFKDKNKPGKNALGTKYWKGGMSFVGEYGPELVQIPRGSKIYTNRETKNMTKTSGDNVKQDNQTNISINIAKLGDTLLMKEDANVQKIASKLAEEIKDHLIAYGGV